MEPPPAARPYGQGSARMPLSNREATAQSNVLGKHGPPSTSSVAPAIKRSRTQMPHHHAPRLVPSTSTPGSYEGFSMPRAPVPSSAFYRRRLSTSLTQPSMQQLSIRTAQEQVPSVHNCGGSYSFIGPSDGRDPGDFLNSVFHDVTTPAQPTTVHEPWSVSWDCMAPEESSPVASTVATPPSVVAAPSMTANSALVHTSEPLVQSYSWESFWSPGTAGVYPETVNTQGCPPPLSHGAISEAIRGAGMGSSGTDPPMFPVADNDGLIMQRVGTTTSSLSLDMGAVPSHHPMERSTSMRSNASQRNKDRLQRQVDNATRNFLQPRRSPPTAEGAAPTLSRDVEDLPTLPRRLGDAGYCKPSMSRASRPAARSEKLYCDLCDERPNGFRGEHELRRHKAARHEEMVTRYVCRDPRPLNIPTSLVPLHPLDKCKHCVGGKQYGRYDNMAAHLRRAHFQEKQPRRSRHGPFIGGLRDSLARDGPPDDLPMTELKKWMTEVHVSAAQLRGGAGDGDKVTGSPGEGETLAGETTLGIDGVDGTDNASRHAAGAGDAPVDESAYAAGAIDEALMGIDIDTMVLPQTRPYGFAPDYDAVTDQAVLELLDFRNAHLDMVTGSALDSEQLLAAPPFFDYLNPRSNGAQF